MRSESFSEQRLQLAQVDAGGMGGEGKLASSASDKESAATFMEQDLLPDTQAASCMAEGGGGVHPPLVGSAGSWSSVLKPDTGLKGLSGWATDKGVSEAMAVWQGQAERLMGLLLRELTALRGANTLFQDQDSAIGAQFGLPSFGQRPLRSRIDGM